MALIYTTICTDPLLSAVYYNDPVRIDTALGALTRRYSSPQGLNSLMHLAISNRNVKTLGQLLTCPYTKHMIHEKNWSKELPALRVANTGDRKMLEQFKNIEVEPSESEAYSKKLNDLLEKRDYLSFTLLLDAVDETLPLDGLLPKLIETGSPGDIEHPDFLNAVRTLLEKGVSPMPILYDVFDQAASNPLMHKLFIILLQGEQCQLDWTKLYRIVEAEFQIKETVCVPKEADKIYYPGQTYDYIIERSEFCKKHLSVMILCLKHHFDSEALVGTLWDRLGDKFEHRYIVWEKEGKKQVTDIEPKAFDPEAERVVDWMYLEMVNRSNAIKTATLEEKILLWCSANIKLV